jgi:hypothetical protein
VISNAGFRYEGCRRSNGSVEQTDAFTTVRLFSQCLNVPSLFGLDGNETTYNCLQALNLNLRYLDIRKEGIVLIIM